MNPEPDRPAEADSPDALDLADRVADRIADRIAAALAEAVETARTPPPLLDLAGAAARLNVSERTVEALVAAGKIPVTRIGTGRGRRLFDPAALDAFIRRSTRTC